MPESPVEWAALAYKMLGFKAPLEVFFAMDIRYAKLPSTVTPGRGFAIERLLSTEKKGKQMPSLIRKTIDVTTDMTTGETTSHPTKQPEDGCQVVGYSHLTNPASEKLLDGHPKDAGQVIGYSHSTRPSKNDSQVAGYVRAPVRRTFMSRMLFVWSLVLAAVFVDPAPAMAEYGDVVINNYSDAAGMRPVVFPHWFHRIRFRCKVCHADLGFKFKAGGNDINMYKIIEGKFCGACHNGNVAWSVKNCILCHSGKPGTPIQIHESTMQELAVPVNSMTNKK